VTLAQVQQLLAGQWYADVHTTAKPNGEIRGQILNLFPQTRLASGGFGKSLGAVDEENERVIYISKRDFENIKTKIERNGQPFAFEPERRPFIPLFLDTGTEKEYAEFSWLIRSAAENGNLWITKEP
jgi:predicted enzyme related to lactoylglutathione lyase